MTCPREAFPDIATAEAELVARRARAALGGNPHTHERVAHPCKRCGLAHIVRASDVDELQDAIAAALARTNLSTGGDVRVYQQVHPPVEAQD